MGIEEYIRSLPEEKQERARELIAKVWTNDFPDSERLELLEIMKDVPSMNDAMTASVSNGDFSDVGFASMLKNKVENYNLWKGNQQKRALELGQLYEAAQNELKSERASDIANMIVRGLDVATGLSQQKQADKSLRNQEPPKTPAQRRKSEPLRNAIMEARMRSANPLSTQEAQAMEAGIEDAYQADLAMGRTGAMGQQGRLSSLGQSAVNRRYRNLRQMTPQLANIRRQSDSRLDRLIGTDIREDAQLQGERERAYQRDLDMYIRAQQAAGQLGQAGRTNVRRGLAGLANRISPLMRTYQNPYEGYKSNGLPSTGGNSNTGTQFDPITYEERMNQQLSNSVNRNNMRRFDTNQYLYR